MKTQFTALLGLVFCLQMTSTAQDIIIKKTGEEIEAKVVVVNNTQVIYKKWINQNGPDYTINKEEIFMIKYPNGAKEVYTDANNPTKISPKSDDVVQKNADTVKNMPILKKRYNSIFGNLGGYSYLISVNYERKFFINDNIFLTASVGMFPLIFVNIPSGAATVNLGGKNDFLECGIGGGYYLLNRSEGYYSGESPDFGYYTPLLGYRRESNTGFLFRINFTVLKIYNKTNNVYKPIHIPFMGISFGYTF